PRGRRAVSFCGFLGLSAMGGVGISRRAARQPCLLPCLLPLWEKVARSTGGRSRRMRGLYPRRETPHPPSLREGTLPQGERGRSACLALRRGCLALGLRLGGGVLRT